MKSITGKVRNTLFGTTQPVSLLPGIALGVAIMLTAQWASIYLGEFFKSQFQMNRSPVSMFLLAIIFGMVVRNIIPLPPIFEKGIQFCVKKLLRLGIIFLGIRLSIMAIARIGIIAFLVTSCCVICGILASYYLSKAAGVNSRLGTLIASGTGICGVSAIVALSPCIDAREEETAYAISTITIFGLLVTLVYPYIIETVFHLAPGQAGLFLGTAIHDTSQVTGAAYIYDQLWGLEVSQVAITTKLIRNVMMVAVIPILAMVYAKENNTQKGAFSAAGLWHFFPKFVLGFLAFALFRSLGDYLLTGKSHFLFWDSAQSWGEFCLTIKTAAKYLLAIAITGAGLCTRFSKLKKLSYKPLIIGFGAALIVGAVSYILIHLLAGPISKLI